MSRPPVNSGPHWARTYSGYRRMLTTQAGTSHLPHIIASALAGVTPPNHLNLTAGGWRDVTRIAAADPALWTQILLENRVHVLKSLTGFEKTVQAIRTAMEREDAAQLRALLTEGKQVRDALGD
jgi:prephenate dehydrogenase